MSTPVSPFDPSDNTFDEVYAELKAIAAARMRGERVGHTLSITDVVHETIVRMGERKGFNDRNHFMNAAALAMRRLLVDHARSKRSQKRGGQWVRIDLEDIDIENPASCHEELIEVNDALSSLASLDERKARVVELSFFGGFTQAEIADLLGISESTVKREWEFSRAWLYDALKKV